jgi:hypothetical protein
MSTSMNNIVQEEKTRMSGKRNTVLVLEHYLNFPLGSVRLTIRYDVET